METNNPVPRQRNRRADRSAAEAPQQAQSTPVQQPQSPAPKPAYQQPYQRPSAPIRSLQQGYPPAYPRYPQHGQQPQQVQQPVQPPSVQYAPRPKALEQRTAAQSGWQQPGARVPLENPQARAGRGLTQPDRKPQKAAPEKSKFPQKPAQEEASPDKKEKLPGWLTTAMTLCFLGVLALIAAYWLMNAYLVTQEQKRIAAYEAILSNYHVTEQPDGTLTVTWQDYIEKYSAAYNLQPAFVTAIIRNESSFRANAESSVGARGLMQLMPDTAEWIAGKLDDDSYTFDSMWDPETNIRYGCWYLGYLSRLFHGDPVLISAAYHAGQTTVTQWLSDPDKSPDHTSLDLSRMAAGPTKQYIGRVTQTYGIYQSLLYPDEAFGAADAVPAGSDSAASGSR